MKSAFASTAAILGLFGLASASPVSKRAATNANGTDIDTVILQYALTLEHLEDAFYSEFLNKYNASAFADAGYPAGVRERFTEIANDESTHVAVLTNALGSNATAACTYNFSSVTGPESFAGLSAVLESVGVSAYLGAAQNITSAAYLAVAASILTVEARHQAWVGGTVVKNGTAYPAAFDTPLTSFSTVYSLAAQFISSCPSTNPTLPVTQFPSLTIDPATAIGGDLISLNFNDTANKGQTVYAAFFNGLNPTFVAINENNTVTVPTTIEGTTYVVVTSSNTALTDTNAIAGVGILSGTPGSN